MNRCYITIAFLFSLTTFCNESKGQFRVFNEDVKIFVEAGATFYVGGDYIDNSTNSDGQIRVEGDFVIHGNITAQTESEVFEKLPTATGEVIFSGSDPQVITNGSDAVFIPQFIVSKTADHVTVSGHVFTNLVNFANGNISLEGKLGLYNLGSITNETESKRFQGTGSVSVFIDKINTGNHYPNPNQLGLGFQVSGAYNDLTIYRHHQPANNSSFGVADNLSATRFYSVYVPLEGNDFDVESPGFEGPYFNSLTYSFLSVERGSLSDGGMAVYFSNDEGATWLKLPAVSAPGATSIVNNVDIAVASGRHNYFVAAKADCPESFKPDAIPRVDNGHPTFIEQSASEQVLKVCFGDSLALSSDAYYYHWEYNGAVVLINDRLHLDADDLLMSGETYTLFERSENGCEKSIAYTLDVMPLPVASFTQDPNNGTSCFLEEMQFANTSSAEREDLHLASFSWAFADNDASSTLENPAHTFSAPGSYNVELVVENQYGCLNSNRIINDVVVHALPATGFEFIGLDGDACEFETFGVDNTSVYEDWDGTEVENPENGLSYVWEFEAGATSVVYEPTYAYEVYGPKTVTLTATENLTGCSATISKGVLIDPRPVPEFHFKINGDDDVDGTAEGVCEGISIFFANTSEIADNSPLSHFWTFGDGSTSTEVSPLRHYTQEGSYSVTLEVTSDTHGCVYSLTKDIVIHPTAEGHFNMQAGAQTISDICAGDEVFFNNKTFIPGHGSIGYLWDFGDGTTSTEISPSHAFAEPRLHVVKLQRTSEFGCVNSVSRQLYVHAYPVADFLVENQCEGQPLEFNNTSYVVGDQLDTYEWVFGDGHTSSLENPEHLYEAYGIHDVALTVASDASCATTVNKEVTVYRTPDLELPVYALSCTGSVLLDAINDPEDYPVSDGSFSWRDKSGVVIANTASVEVTTSGSYYLDVITDTPANCEANYSIPAFIVKPGDLGPDGVICESTELDAQPAFAPSQGILSYEWRRDGELLSNTTERLQATETGDYEVVVSYTLTNLVDQPSCSYTDVVHVKVDTPPAVDLGDDIQICQGSTTTLESNVVADSYEWTNLSTGQVIGSTSSLEISEAGDFKLFVRQGTCFSSDIITIEVLPLPEVSFLASDHLICQGEDVSFTNLSFTMSSGDPLISHHWNYGDGSSSASANVTKSFDSPGVYTVVLTVVTQQGCVASHQQEITVVPYPSALFTATNSCEKTAINFLNSSSITDGSALSYKWSFGDGTVSTQQEPSKSYLKEGVYTVTLEVWSANGCQSQFSHEMEIYPNPEGTFTMEAEGAVVENVCPEENVRFNNQSFLPDGKPLIYSWDFGDGTTSNAESPEKAFAATGLYAISLTRITEDGCGNTVSRQLRVNPTPEVAFTVGNVCDGEVMSFHNVSAISSGSIETFYWDFGDGNNSSLENPQHTYETYGDFEVKLTVASSAACGSELIQSVSVFRRPSFSLGDYGLSVKGQLTLNPRDDPEHYIPPGSSFTWKNSTGEIISTEEAADITVAGNYSVEVVTSAPESCSVGYSIPVFITQPPDLGADLVVCQEANLDISPASYPLNGDLSYIWTKDGELLVGTGPHLKVNETGTYGVSITYTLTDFPTQPSASYSDQIHVTVENPTPVDIGKKIVICEGSSTILNSNVIADSYEWLFLDTGEILSNSSTLEVSEGGDYKVTVVTGACTSFDIVTIEVLNPPEAGFSSSNDTVCFGEDILFTSNSYSLEESDPLTSFLWNFGDGTTADVAHTSKLFTAPGKYQVSLQVSTLLGCTAAYQEEITVDAPQEASFTASNSCEETEVNFINTSSNLDGEAGVEWNFGDGEKSNSKDPAYTYYEPGLHEVTLTITSGSCKTTFSQEVEIYVKPTADLGEELVTCGEQLQIDGGAEMESYRWYHVSSGTTLSNERYFTAVESGEIGLEVTNSNGCQVTDETIVNLNSAVDINLGPDREVCGSEILDAGLFPGVDYQWSTGETGRFLAISESGIYRVDVTDQNGCVAGDQVTIIVTTQPELDLGDYVQHCLGETVILDASNPGAAYQWSTGENTRTILVEESGTYEVEVSYGGCAISEIIQVEMLAPPSIDFGYEGNCTGESLRFFYAGTSTDLSYVWDFGDGNQSNKAQPRKSFNLPNSYDVTLEVTDKNGCSSRITRSVVIQPKPIPDFYFTSACEGKEISFSNATFYTGSDNLSYSWQFGTGDTSPEEDPGYHYFEPASYIVGLTVENGYGCSGKTSKTLIVKPKPIVDIEDYIETCNPSVVLNAENFGSTFLWSDGTVEQTLAVTESGEYSVVVTTDEGCIAYDTVEVNLLENEKPQLGVDIEVCGEFFLTPGITANAYLWSTGSVTPDFKVSKSGTYWVQTVNEALCINRDTVEVVVHKIPVFSLGNDIERCEGDSVILKTNTNIPASYLWSDGSINPSLTVRGSGNYGVTLGTEHGCSFTDDIDVLFNSLPTPPLNDEYETCEDLLMNAGDQGDLFLWSNGEIAPQLEIKESGSYWVRITNSNGCSITDFTEVTINKFPVVDLGVDIQSCMGELVILDAGNLGAEYLWSTGEITRQIAVEESGTYAVEVAYGNCTASDAININMFAPPSSEFAYAGMCTEEEIRFYPTETGDGGDYLWDFGDGTRSVNEVPQKVYDNANSYLISLKLTNEEGCSSVTSKEVTIHPRPIINFSYDNTCVETEVVFENATSYSGNDALSYQWDFDDGSTSFEQSPAHTFTDPGLYTVKLTVANESLCYGSVFKSVDVRPVPRVDLGGNVEICDPSIILDAANEGSIFKWSNNSTSQALLVTRSGEYSVSVTNAHGCIAYDTIRVNLLENETPFLGEYKEACGEVVLDPGLSAASYFWSTGELSPTIQVNETGNYWVQTISADLCANMDTVDVTLHPVPIFSLGADVEKCEGEKEELFASTTLPVNYFWNDGSVNSSLEVTETGTYSVILSTEEGCSFSDEVEILFYQLPEQPLADSYEACESFLLHAQNPGSSYEWSNGGELSECEITETGDYWVRVTNQAGCVITDSTSVTINPLPQPDLGQDLEICYGETVTVDAGLFSSYQWNDLPGERYNEIGVSGTYTATVSNEYGCSGSDEFIVTVREPIGLDLGPDQYICSPEDFLLDAGIDTPGYLWASSNGFSSKDKTIYPTETGEYILTVTDSFGCIETDMIQVMETTELIEASFLIPSIVSVGEAVNFVQLTEPAPLSYRWSFGDGRIATKTYNPSMVYHLPAEYEVSLSVSNGICSDTGTKLLTVVEGRTHQQPQDRVNFIEFYKANLFPNPTQDYITLDVELSDQVVVNIQLFSLSGLKVAEYEFHGFSELVQFDLTGFLPGTYIVRVLAGRHAKTIRFVKIL